MKIIRTTILILAMFCFEAQSEQKHINVMQGVEMVKEQISLGYDINGINSSSYTPLMSAAFMNRLAEAEVLINAGADVNYTDKHGSTALHIATYRANLDFVKLLVKSGAYVNSFDKILSTPVNIAAMQGKTEIVKILVDNGADLNRVNIFGKTILNRIRNAEDKLLNYKQIEKILVENGAMDISSQVGNQITKEGLLAILGSNSHVYTEEKKIFKCNQVNSTIDENDDPLEYGETESCN